MKKLMVLALAMIMVLSMVACGGEEKKGDGTYKVGICQLAPHDALDAATEGFKKALTDEFGDKVTFIEENAAGEPANCTTIINSLISSKVDLIMAYATPALQVAANATRTIPVLGTSVTEYGVALGIDDFSGTVGTNVSGTSDLADLEQQANMILEWFPEAQNVGLLYCSAEANSLYQVNKVSEYLTAKGVTCQMFAFTDTSDMNQVTTDAAAWSDVIYVPTDNVVANATDVVANVCRTAKVPVIAGEEGACKGCGVATLSISYYDLGYTTGQMAVKILKGEAKPQDMAIEYAPTTKKYNAEMCEFLGITPIEGYEKIG